MSEVLVDVETVAGPLLTPRGDLMITRILERDGVWEPAETKFLQQVLRTGYTFVDVGAHVGYFSVLAARSVGPTGTVLAFEPEARNFELLQRNLDRNGCTQARAFPYAAHAHEGFMSLVLHEENRGAHHLVALGETENVVQCVRLDDVLPARVDVVKIDVQGYDHDVVAGLTNTISRNPHLIIITELSRGELLRRGIDAAHVLGGYHDLGCTLSIFDRYGHLRPTPVATLIDLHHQQTLPADVSIVLTFDMGSASTSEEDYCPRPAVGVERHESADGVIIYEPVTDRAHHLNHTAALVFDFCSGNNNVRQITTLLQEAFDLTDRPDAEVAECLVQMGRLGLITLNQSASR